MTVWLIVANNTVCWKSVYNSSCVWGFFSGPADISQLLFAVTCNINFLSQEIFIGQLEFANEELVYKKRRRYIICLRYILVVPMFAHAFL